MTFPDHITVLHKLRTEPQSDTDHFILDVLILSELQQRPAARLKPFMVEAFRNSWREQVEAKHRNEERVNALLERVGVLEKGCWDKEGAVEKMGM